MCMCVFVRDGGRDRQKERKRGGRKKVREGKPAMEQKGKHAQYKKTDMTVQIGQNSPLQPQTITAT